MDEEEDRSFVVLLGACVQPARHRFDRARTGDVALRVLRVRTHAALVDVEPLAEAVGRIEVRSAEESGRAPPGVAKHGGDGARGLREPHPVVHEAVRRVAQPGEHGRVCGQRPRSRADGRLTARTLAREAIDGRAGRLPVSVATEVVEAQGIDRDQDHVGASGAMVRRGVGPSTPCGGQEQAHHPEVGVGGSPGRKRNAALLSGLGSARGV